LVSNSHLGLGPFVSLQAAGPRAAGSGWAVAPVPAATGRRELLVWGGTRGQAGSGTATGRRRHCKMTLNRLGAGSCCGWTRQERCSGVILGARPSPASASAQRHRWRFHRVGACLSTAAPLHSATLLLIASSQLPENYRSISKIWLLPQLSQELGLSQLFKLCET